MKSRIRDFIPTNGGGVLTLTLFEDFRNTYDELIAKLKEKGIDLNTYAAEKGLNKETTPERYAELLKELES